MDQYSETHPTVKQIPDPDGDPNQEVGKLFFLLLQT